MRSDIELGVLLQQISQAEDSVQSRKIRNKKKRLSQLQEISEWVPLDRITSQPLPLKQSPKRKNVKLTLPPPKINLDVPSRYLPKVTKNTTISADKQVPSCSVQLQAGSKQSIKNKKTTHSVSKSFHREVRLHPILLKMPEDRILQSQSLSVSCSNATSMKNHHILHNLEIRARKLSRLKQMDEQYNDQKLMNGQREDSRNQFIHRLFKTKRLRQQPLDSHQSEMLQRDHFRSEMVFLSLPQT